MSEEAVGELGPTPEEMQKQQEVQQQMQVLQGEFQQKAQVALGVFGSLVAGGAKADEAAKRCFALSDFFITEFKVQQGKVKVQFDELAKALK